MRAHEAKKTKLMLYSTLVEIEVEVGVELGKNIEANNANPLLQLSI